MLAMFIVCLILYPYKIFKCQLYFGMPSSGGPLCVSIQLLHSQLFKCSQTFDAKSICWLSIVVIHMQGHTHTHVCTHADQQDLQHQRIVLGPFCLWQPNIENIPASRIHKPIKHTHRNNRGKSKHKDWNREVAFCVVGGNIPDDTNVLLPWSTYCMLHWQACRVRLTWLGWRGPWSLAEYLEWGTCSPSCQIPS